jgi:hypothetical protein
MKHEAGLRTTFWLEGKRKQARGESCICIKAMRDSKLSSASRLLTSVPQNHEATREYLCFYIVLLVMGYRPKGLEYIQHSG